MSAWSCQSWNILPQEMRGSRKACVCIRAHVCGGGDSLILVLSGPFSSETETLQAEGG